MQTNNVIEFPVWRANPAPAFMDSFFDKAIKELDELQAQVAQLERELDADIAKLRRLENGVG